MKSADKLFWCAKISQTNEVFMMSDNIWWNWYLWFFVNKIFSNWFHIFGVKSVITGPGKKRSKQKKKFWCSTIILCLGNVSLTIFPSSWKVTKKERNSKKTKHKKVHHKQSQCGRTQQTNTTSFSYTRAPLHSRHINWRDLQILNVCHF